LVGIGNSAALPVSGVDCAYVDAYLQVPSIGRTGLILFACGLHDRRPERGLELVAGVECSAVCSRIVRGEQGGS
jgi:hypothetical protein